MIRAVAIICAVFLCVLLVACQTYESELESTTSTESPIIIPDVLNSEEAVAKNIISSLGLFPDIQYRYNDTVAQGKVIRTTPDVGSTVKMGDTVVLFVSKGPQIVKPKEGSFCFDDVYEDSADNQQASVRKENGILYIDCNVVFLSVRTKYVVPEEGFASTDPNFMFSIPIKITNISQNDVGHLASRNKFTIEIPLDELGDNAPTHIYLNLDRTDLDPGAGFLPVTTRKRAWFALKW